MCKCNAVDPDEVGVVEGDAVSAPDVLWIDLVDAEIVEDHVLVMCDAQAFAADRGVGRDADDGLVGRYRDGSEAGFVVGDGCGAFVFAPALAVVDRQLAFVGALDV